MRRGHGSGAGGARRKDKPASTRELLLLTAERLFAERGLEAVSLTEIREAAGQRNASAINYHFGGREELVRAIIDYRAETLNARRNELLDALEESGRCSDVELLAEALVRPLAEQVRPGNHYVGFLARVTNPVTYERPDSSSSMFARASLTRLERMVHGALPELPEPVVQRRVALGTGLVINDLAAVQARRSRRSVDAPPIERVIEDLVDVLVGIFTARSRRAERAERAGLPSGPVGAGATR